MIETHLQSDLIAATTSPWLVVIALLPFVGAAINGTLGARLMRRFGPKANHTLAIALPAMSFLLTVLCLYQLLALPAAARALSQNLFPFIHIGAFDSDMAFWFDPLSATMTLIITFIGTLIHLYAVGYMRGDASYWRFFAYLNLFMGCMLLLVLGDNLLVMFIGWEGVGLCSYLLISFWYKEKANAVAGMKAFVVNRVGDFGFLLGAALLFWGLAGTYDGALGTQDRYTPEAPPVLSAAMSPGDAGALDGATPPMGHSAGASLRFDAIRTHIAQHRDAWRETSPSAKQFMGIPLVVVICLLLFFGATGKSAQIPLYVWLPDAMAGPTPVSALIHAATMVTAGVYLVARLNFLFALSPTAMTVVALCGALTALFAATIGLFQYDIKKVLAYSTVSQLGYMFIGVGVGAYWAGIFHLLTHAVFKACLFLGSGSVILGCHHEQDMRKMGGLKKYMPLTHWTYWAACVAITTAPFFLISNGFFSKDEILWKAFAAQHLLVPGYLIWCIGFIGAGLTSFYMWRSYYMTFTGSYRGHSTVPAAPNHDHHSPHAAATPHESPRSMTAVLLVLTALIGLTIALGFWPLVGLHPLLEAWLRPVLGASEEFLSWLPATTATHHLEMALAAASIAISLLGWYGARALYRDAKSALPARLLAKPSRLLQKSYAVVFNKYYVDEFYDAVVVRQARRLAAALAAFDRWVIDGLVNLMPLCGRAIAAVDALFDQVVVDGLVNGVASAALNSGRKVRRLQTGCIQTYLFGAIAGATVLVAAIYLLF